MENKHRKLTDKEFLEYKERFDMLLDKLLRERFAGNVRKRCNSHRRHLHRYRDLLIQLDIVIVNGTPMKIVPVQTSLPLNLNFIFTSGEPFTDTGRRFLAIEEQKA